MFADGAGTEPQLKGWQEQNFPGQFKEGHSLFVIEAESLEKVERSH